MATWLRRTFIVSADLESRLPILIKNYPQDKQLQLDQIEQRIRELNQYDPTLNKAVFTPWLVNMDNNGSLPTNLNEITTTLSEFIRLKSFKPEGLITDITQFSTYGELHDHVMEYIDFQSKKETENEDRSTAVASIEQIQGLRILGTENGYTIIEVTDPKASVQLCKQFGITSWCVHQIDYAADYVPLYYVLQGDSLVAVWSAADNELSNRQNQNDPNMAWIQALSKFVPAFEKYVKKYDVSLPSGAVYYARDVLKGRFEAGEPTISKDAEYSYLYARDVLKGRFEAGEPAISKDYISSYDYARDVLKGRFEAGEPAISKDYISSYLYARDILKGRFEAGEPVISKEALYSYRYARDVLKGKFEAGEPAISKDYSSSYDYARDVLKGRFEAGEPAISKDYSSSYDYARDVLKGRFEAGEPAISKDYSSSYRYAQFLNGVDPKGSNEYRQKYLNVVQTSSVRTQSASYVLAYLKQEQQSLFSRIAVENYR